jgi:aconitate hydratase
MVDAFGTAQGAADQQRRARLPAQPRALRVPALGPAAFNNFRVVPPATGIVHQVNLEYLAKTVWTATA